MKQNCEFNPLSDYEKVVPDLSINISEIMATHTVPNTGTSVNYTKETEVGEVGHYLTDKIQATVAAYRLRQSMASAKSAMEKKSAVNAPAQ